jgi:hypothetical protein
MRAPFFANRFAVIQNVFGDDWLSRKPTHPLQVAWEQAQHELESPFRLSEIQRGNQVDLRHCAALTLIEKVAVALDGTRHLAGFEQSVLPELIKPSKFESTLHECEVASWFTKGGLTLEFVETSPTTEKRTPDLKILAQGREIEVECKRREPCKASTIPEEMEAWAHDQFQAMLGRVDSDLEIKGLIIGATNKDTISAALQRLEKLASDGVRGFRFESDLLLHVEISESPTDVPNGTKEDLAAWSMSRGLVSVRTVPREFGNGVFGYSKFKGIGVFALEGHNYRQVESSLREARGQLSKDKLGIIVVEVDLSGVSLLNPRHEAYLRILAQAVLIRAWGGNSNTRLGAIVLKLSSATKTVTEKSCVYNTNVNAYYPVVRHDLKVNHHTDAPGLVDALLAAS